MSDEGPYAGLGEPLVSAPTFVNDEQTTTFVQRRIAMSLDPVEQMTLGRLQEFVAFALAAGAGLDEPVAVDRSSARVLRAGATTEASTPSPA